MQMKRRWLNGWTIGIQATLITVATAGYVWCAPDDLRILGGKLSIGEAGGSLDCRARLIVITPQVWTTFEKAPANRALLISDPGKVCRLERLSRGKKSDDYHCGYHWAISYWDSPTRFDVTSFNEECSEFGPHTKEVHRLLRPHIARLRKAPPHHLYDVHVSASTPPKRIARDLERLGYVPLFWFGTEAHHPAVVLKLTHTSPKPAAGTPYRTIRQDNERSCRRRLTQLSARLGRKFTVTEQGEITYQFFRGTREGRAEVYFRLAPAVDVRNLLRHLRSERVEVLSYQPLLDLRLVVVDPEADLKKLRRKLRGALLYVRKVTSHPGWLPSPRAFIEERKVPHNPLGGLFQ